MEKIDWTSPYPDLPTEDLSSRNFWIHIRLLWFVIVQRPEYFVVSAFFASFLPRPEEWILVSTLSEGHPTGLEAKVSRSLAQRHSTDNRNVIYGSSDKSSDDDFGEESPRRKRRRTYEEIYSDSDAQYYEASTQAPQL